LESAALIEPGFIATPIFSKVERREWSTYYPQTRRGLALFKASLQNQNPTPASVVGDRIVEIVNRAETPLRHLVGADATGLLNWRSSMTDEQWIAWWGVESEVEWAANVKRVMGIDVSSNKSSSSK
jgi:hypothetical protein